MAYEGRPLEATLATVQQFVSARGDGWELTRDTLAAASTTGCRSTRGASAR